uniref:Glycosyltransferase 2-like domain-containing protein n=1 Tax=Ciona savignyi TaxID=51511 RepID=H2Z4W0_CIOSA
IMVNINVTEPLVSLIIPVYNGEQWVESCFQSILEQTWKGPLEVCVFNDGSTDQSMDKINSYGEKLTARGIQLNIHSMFPEPKGCGFAKNRCVERSKGNYLCFLDIDDVMHPDRIKAQLSAAMQLPALTLIGCQITREPKDATVRYTRWINRLNSKQLLTQVYTSHGPTVIMPTWFCHRSVFDLVGGFCEDGKGVPEDYIFFLRFLELKGELFKVERPLLTYRHHAGATTFSVLESTIWKLRLEALQKNVLSKWEKFTIWNAGKQGRKLFRDLSATNKAKVTCFCDVDVKKISKGIYIYELSKEPIKPKIPIVHFKNANKPFVICVKLDLTDGEFEKNLHSLNLVEGVDYVHFN